MRIAFEIELGGRAFYQRAAADSNDEELRALFGRFAIMEGEHMETLSRRYHIEVPEPSEPFRLELAAVFADVENRPHDPANLFRIAIALEHRAASFFASRADKVPKGSAEQRLYQELAAEEREHAALLSTEYARWQRDTSRACSVATQPATPQRPTTPRPRRPARKSMAPNCCSAATTTTGWRWCAASSG